MATLSGSAPIMAYAPLPGWHHHVLSGAEEAGAIVNNLLHYLAQANFSEREQFAVRLSLEEAIVNAVKHGNDSDPSKIVTVDFQVTSNELIVRIEDEGQGFAPDDVPDPLAPENLERPGGRGVFLMRHYMTSVEFNERGNGVTLTKRRG